ncbi:SDR family oxidoreductase [Qingshengfaniella alkalisoli]|uniref:SDR family oxidoreductase n=1 Tax=Qingshengfaniella alkalisoli TaxID=2599296 RepID=A0A5B8JBC0_9RHOB|nr:SDR family oxidoreductase [Qingshengfaniella alkalisoli]QDY71577.1 SDR family oxidoreductase [Qingshengfaniella alkalisoli]
MSTQLFDLTGKTALVTGSSRGLGRAIAEGLGRAGARIILNGVNADRLDRTTDELRRAGLDAIAAPFDVTDEDAVLAAFDHFDADSVEIDILVNNAGIQIRGPIIDYPTKNWRKVIDTNLTSAFIVGREAGRRMVARGQGKVINIGSLMSGLGRATTAPYAAAKGGIKLLTQTMTAEWARSGVQVNAIGPGYMVTDLNEVLTSDEKFDSWVKSRTPTGRWGQPEELVGTAVFLASDASNYVSGQIIYVDGGMSAVI